MIAISDHKTEIEARAALKAIGNIIGKEKGKVELNSGYQERVYTVFVEDSFSNTIEFLRDGYRIGRNRDMRITLREPKK